MEKQTLSVAAAYAASVLVLSIYGVEVCPFVEGLGYIGVASSFFVSFGVAFVLRTAVRNALPAPPIVVLLKEWLGWLLAGGGVCAYNAIAYDFPSGSAAKIMIGTIALGVPSATHTALLVERQRILRIQNQGERHGPVGPARSTTARLYRFTLLSQVLLATVIVLLIGKDLAEFLDSFEQGVRPPVELIAVEIFGAFTVLLVANALVAGAYARNLDILLQGQIATMEAVSAGNLNVVVPVVANDEIARIGDRTNSMIQALRDREKIKSVFGKLLSPQVADALIESDNTLALDGREINAVVAFTDLRGFTTLSEMLPPRELVQCLNEYFSMIVTHVHAEGGTVDKFIGDSAMLVFGLEGTPTAQENVNHALAACFSIVESMDDLKARWSERGLPEIEAGIGLNSGKVVAGSVGSPDRLEYTVIGDPVNTAARLEGLCKDTNSPLVVSEAFYRLADDEFKSRLKSLGHFPLKGKREPVKVFGLPPDSLQSEH